MTEKELLELEEREHDDALETVSAILVLLDLLDKNIQREFKDWYSKYSKDGVLKYSDTRRYLTPKELNDFNREHGTKLKRLRRDKALFLAYSFHTNSFLNDYIEKLHDLGATIIGYEAGQFKFDLDSEEVLATPWGADDKTYEERVNDKRSKYLYELTTATTRGIVREAKPEVISTALVAVVDSFRQNIKTLVLTEATAFAARAKYRIYKVLFPNKHYKNVEVMDERTCPTCQEMNGRIFEMRAYEVGVTAPPYHPRCRGTTKIVD